MTQFTLWGNYASKIQAHSLFSINTTQHRSTNTVLLSEWTTDYTFGMESVMITIHVHLRRKGVLLCYKCDNLKPPPCCAWQVQWVDVFWMLSRGTGQDITPSDPKHCPLPTPKTPAFCLKPGWWQVPLTSLRSPGAAVVVNRVPTTDYTVLIPTNHFTPINNTWNVFPEDIFIAMAAKIYLIITNKLKSKFIVWPIRKVGQISDNTTMLIWADFRYMEGKNILFRVFSLIS